MKLFMQLGGDKKKYFKRSDYIKIHDLQKYHCFIDKFDNTDVYYSIFNYCDNEDIENCPLYGPLYFDIDNDIQNEDIYKKVKRDTLLIIEYLHQDLKVPYKYIDVYFSGSKGFHVMVSPEVFGALPDEDLNWVYKGIAYYANENTIERPLDFQIYDRKRLIRITNSINSKTGLYKVPITIEELRKSSLEAMKSMAQEPREIKKEKPTLVREASDIYFEKIAEFYNMHKRHKKNKNSFKGFDLETLPCVQKVLDEGVQKGIRNESSVSLANSLFQIKYDYDEVTEMLEDWDGRNEPPLMEEDPNEITRSIANAYRLYMVGKNYGCSHYKTIEYCVPDCPIKK